MNRYNIMYESTHVIECRQTKQPTYEDAVKEAELYKAWAEFHYKCEVSYTINEDDERF